MMLIGAGGENLSAKDPARADTFTSTIARILLVQRSSARRTRLWIMLWGALLAASTPAPARDGVVFAHLTVADGLSQGSVNCILQDRFGFMWIGTQDGLNRFDGYECTVFRRNPEERGGLSDNFIYAITEDTAGTLWIRTLTAPDVLHRYDRQTGTFRAIPRDSVNLAGARTNIVRGEFTEPSGIVWKGSIGGGLTRLDPHTGVTTSYTHDPANPRSLGDNRVYSICGDRSGDIWIGTKEGLDRLDPRTGVFTHYRHAPGNPSSLSHNWVWAVMEDREGRLWVGTYQGGLNLFDRETETFTRYRNDPADPRSLGADQIFSLAQDRSGMIWVGLKDAGVDRFHPEFAPFERYVSSPSDPRGLTNNTILSMAVDRTGNVWIGTADGLNRFDPARKAFAHFRTDPRNPRSIGSDQVECILEDRTGMFWFGMVNGGLDRYDPSTGVFTHYRNDPANPRSLSDNRVYALCEGADGELWVGTYGGGLNRMDTRRGTFTRFVHAPSDSGSLGGPGVFALLKDRAGTLWIGTYGGGLDRFDPETGTFSHHRHDASDSRSISDDLVLCLFEDRAGTLWVGTSGGLNALDRQTGIFTRYRENDGLPNDFVFGILGDARGRVWVSTNKGIARLDPASKAFKTFGYSDGLQADEFNQNAYASDARTGFLYFGGPAGFNRFHPDNVRENTYRPAMVFSGFTRYNTDDAEGRPIVEPGIDARQDITLSYKDNVAIFEFAALSYLNPDRNQYAYRLEGFNENWINLGTERRATFTNLDGGTYELTVRGSNNDGVWNDEGRSITVVVTPPWWKTSWAYGSYGVALLLLLYTARRVELERQKQKARIRESELRAKAAEAEKRALEAENARKTKELEDARALQLSMLPQSVPQVPGYRIAVFMRTATEVGGDYYDFAGGQNGDIDIAIGDATGHGMQAGTIVTLMKGLFVSDAGALDLQTFLSRCSRAIKQLRLGRLYMAFTLVRLRGKSVSLSSAGMPPVYVYRKESGAVEEVLMQGMPLGAMAGFPYAVHESELRPGDTLLMLTDGLPEQKNSAGELFGYPRLEGRFADAARSAPDEIIAGLVRETEAWIGSGAPDDDVTLLVVQRTE